MQLHTCRGINTTNTSQSENIASKAERVAERSEIPAVIPADAVAEELLGLLALADEEAGLHLLRMAARLHNPARGALLHLVPGAGGEAGDVAEAPAGVAAAVVVVPTPTHRVRIDLGKESGGV
jgi:hypothetical protein